jgi:hypothetical protein
MSRGFVLNKAVFTVLPGREVFFLFDELDLLSKGTFILRMSAHVGCAKILHTPKPVSTKDYVLGD